MKRYEMDKQHDPCDMKTMRRLERGDKVHLRCWGDMHVVAMGAQARSGRWLVATSDRALNRAVDGMAQLVDVLALCLVVADDEETRHFIYGKGALPYTEEWFEGQHRLERFAW